MDISIKNLNKYYGSKLVLSDLNLNLKKGNRYGLVGPNGAGKSTLIKILLDIEKPKQGTILLDGEQLNQKSKLDIKRRIGFMIEDDLLVKEFSAYEYINFIGLLYKIPRKELTMRAESLLNFFFNGENYRGNKIGNYSAGMKQKVRLCASVINNPDLLILDEPFVGIDLPSFKRIETFLKDLMKDRTILIASHNLASIQNICSHLILLDEGVVKYAGELSEFWKSKDSFQDTILKLINTERPDYELLEWIKK